MRHMKDLRLQRTVLQLQCLHRASQDEAGESRGSHHSVNKLDIACMLWQAVTAGR